MFPQQSQDAPKSLLADLRNYHKVLVHNPLSQPFTWQIARSVVQNDPRYVDQTIAQMNMRNDAHPTMAHVYSYVTIEAGETKYLPGDVAQTYVKHLVDELMYKAGHKQTVGDPHLRRQFEEEVVLNAQDLRSDLSTKSMEDQLAKQIEDMNRDPAQIGKDTVGHDNEQAFPDITANRQAGNGSQDAGEPAGSTAFEQQDLGTEAQDSTEKPSRRARNSEPANAS